MKKAEKNAFLLRNQNKKDSTLYQYQCKIHRIEKEVGKHIDDMTEEEVLQYLAQFKNAKTWNGKFCFFKRYFNEYKGHNWFQGMKRMKEVRNPRESATLAIKQEHIQWLMDACIHLRDRAAIAVVAEMGFRRGEWRVITIGDVTFDQYGVTIRCPDGKTGPRPVNGIWCQSAVAAWYNAHPFKGHPEKPFFCVIASRATFCRKERNGVIKEVDAVEVGDYVSPQNFNILIKSALTRARKLHPEIPNFFPHLGRHYSASNAAKDGMDSEQLKKRYGWTSNEMPSIYCHLTNADANDAYLRIHGIVKTKVQNTEKLQCGRCHNYNALTASYCDSCGMPLTREVAQKLEEKKQDLRVVQQDPDVMAEFLKEARKQLLESIRNDPGVLKDLLASKA